MQSKFALLPRNAQYTPKNSKQEQCVSYTAMQKLIRKMQRNEVDRGLHDAQWGVAVCTRSLHYLGMKIVLPFPPSVNAMFGGGSKQRRFPSKAYKAWQVQADRVATSGKVIGPVSVCYTFFWPDKRRRDLTNYVKAPEDWLVKKGTLADDGWEIVRAVVLLSGGIDKSNPRVEIEINEVARR